MVFKEVSCEMTLSLTMICALRSLWQYDYNGRCRCHAKITSAVSVLQCCRLLGYAKK